MDCCVPTAAYLPVTCTRKGNNREMLKTFRHICFAKNRGFGTDPTKRRKESIKTPKENVSTSSDPSKLASGVSRTRIKEAQELAGTSGKSNDPIFDRQFLEKIESVRRSAYEQKKAEGERNFQPIDYDAPIESEQSKIGLATKIGVGVAVAVFGVVFAFGDSFPSGSNMPSGDNSVIEKKLSEKERSTLEETVRQFQETLSKSPKDSAALEGAAVTLVELGEYQRASSLLEMLIKERPENVDAYRLLGEVKYELKDYEGSAAAYRSFLSTSKNLNFDVLRGLTNALLAAKKPDEAVHVLLSSRENIDDAENIGLKDPTVRLNDVDRKSEGIDPLQVELLLGKAYSDWGHVSDAVAVYDQLISKYPNDFRGYLAKGIILKENGKSGDAERMFIQLRGMRNDYSAPLQSYDFITVAGGTTSSLLQAGSSAGFAYRHDRGRQDSLLRRKQRHLLIGIQDNKWPIESNSACNDNRFIATNPRWS
ncbi:uncharacterized protein LOC110103712 isoform X3 [Dendrobium catenatum]|uniref:uncharacterized protein LOC110103712 isoform X3 n=1 Tax=Dendrobium catenatum TaxID=906689 RepID=UPI0010A03EA0|nr:uncharacterized protein LOC110103712 isoform X3 [Dendrobium catenatum]